MFFKINPLKIYQNVIKTTCELFPEDSREACELF